LSEPLPLFGHLLVLKARQLLAQPSTEEEEEVPVSMEELERRLKEYEQFKTVAQLLAELHQLEQRHFAREPDHELIESIRPEPSDPFNVGITDLLGALQQALMRSTAPIYEVRAEAWTVEMKAEQLTALIRTQRQVHFFEIFSPQKSRLELVVTFLALLELIRQRVVRAFQRTPFDDIEIGWVESHE
jgi:segregation and condensation protein A